MFDVIYKDDTEASLEMKTWSQLEPDFKKRLTQSVLDHLKLKGYNDLPSFKDINNSLRQFYTQRRTTKLLSLDKESRTKKRLAAKVNRLNFVRMVHMYHVHIYIRIFTYSGEKRTSFEGSNFQRRD